MKTPKDSEYDLWISDDGAYMVRGKSTSEVIEVERDVMRVFDWMKNASVGRYRQNKKTTVSYFWYFSQLTKPEKRGWFDTYDFQSELMVNIFKDEFSKTLTQRSFPFFTNAF